MMSIAVYRVIVIGTRESAVSMKLAQRQAVSGLYNTDKVKFILFSIGAFYYEEKTGSLLSSCQPAASLDRPLMMTASTLIDRKQNRMASYIYDLTIDNHQTAAFLQRHYK